MESPGSGSLVPSLENWTVSGTAPLIEAVKAAEQILKREVNAGVHAELLGRLKTEL